MNTLKRPLKTLSSRGVMLFIAVLLTATIVPQILNIKSVSADDGGYPWVDAHALYAAPDYSSSYGYALPCPSKDTECDKGGSSLMGTVNGVTYGEADLWHYGLRNCTSYAAWKINQQFYVNNITGWGNGKDWDTGLYNSQPYPVHTASGYTPQVGDIAQWEAHTGDSFGHVAYVWKVETNGVADLWEYNQAYNGLFTATRTTASGSDGTPDHYIHIGNIQPPAPTSPVPWNFETLDGDPSSVGQYDADAGKNPRSLVYNNALQLFYYDATGRVRHAWDDTSGWHFEVLDGMGGVNGRTTDNVGAAMSVTAYNGTLQLFYYDSTAHTLRHAWSDTNGWHFETLDTSGDVGSASTTLTYGTSLQLYYPNLSNGDLRHAWSDANGWHFENLDGDSGSVAGGQGKAVSQVGSSLASTLDANSNLQLFYYAYGSTGKMLRHAWADANGWHFENLDGGPSGSISGTTDDIGQNPSTVLNGTTLQLFSYNASKGDLRHAWSDANGWHFENLDGTGSSGPDQYTLGLYSTTIMSGTTLQLFYYDSQWGELRHAWSDSSGWHFENLDGLGGLPSGRLGPNMQIGLSPNAVFYNNVPQVFYYDATNGNLRHSWSQ